jgi:hypothetical protein
VLAVSAEVWAVELLIVTDTGERLHVTGLEAPVGEVVTAQVSATVPLNELDGVTVIVEVLPDVEPGLLTLIAPLLDREKSLELTWFQKPLQPDRNRGANNINLIHARISTSPPLQNRVSLPAGAPHPARTNTIAS